MTPAINKTKNANSFRFLAVAVLSFATLFAPRPASAAAGQAAFIRTNTATQGNWKGVYGGDGYVIAQDSQAPPAYATVTPGNQMNWTWASGTADARALQTGSGSSRIAATWYNNPSFSIDVNIADGNNHRIALYLLDWDSKNRSETIQAVDGSTGAVLDTRTAANFVNGAYYLWTVSGHVKFNITRITGDNAVASAAFFDVSSVANSAPGAVAQFVATDSSTEGSWRSKYGADGYTVVGGSLSAAPYAALAAQNQLSWTWLSSTADPRALQNVTGSGGVAATWYNSPTFSIDVNVTDGNSHQFALYALDWDFKGRAETIQVIDANSKAVLDSRSISSFTSGVYIVWSISGHVTFNVTSNSGPNAVIGGAFFGGASQAGTTPQPPTTPSQGTLSVSPSSFNFGTVNIGSNLSQSFTVSNTGAGSVTLSNVTLSGGGLTSNGVSTGISLTPGQSLPFTVTYTPASTLPLAGSITLASNATDASLAVSLIGVGAQPTPPTSRNAVTFNGTDTVTEGAWKGLGNFNAPPASSSLVYGKDGVILPDTEGCDASCNPFPSYVSFGPQLVSSATPGNVGAKPNSNHAYVDLVQAAAVAMGPEPANATNTSFFQCNYTNSNPAIPWAPMVAWRPVVDTREISNWYTCSGIKSFYLEFSFGASTHNFEIYVVDDQNGSTQLRSEDIQVLDGDTGAILYDSGSFTNFTGGVYYRWTITGHVKVQVVNTSTSGTNAVINGVFFN